MKEQVCEGGGVESEESEEVKWRESERGVEEMW